MQKGFKVRIYPTKSQEKLLFEHINSCRFIWNYMLNLQNENHEKGNKYISEFEMNKSLTPLKKEEEYDWLNNCSTSSYQIICRDLNKSFQ